MTELFVSAGGKALDLGLGVAGRLREIAGKDLTEELIEALGVDSPAASKALKAILSKSQGLREVQQFLARAGVKAKEVEPYLKSLTGPVSKIPSEGIRWAWKSTGKARLPDIGKITFKLTGSAGTGALIEPGPLYKFNGTLAAAGSARAPFTFGSVSGTVKRTRNAGLRVSFKHPEPEKLPVVEAIGSDFPVITNLDDPKSLLESAAFQNATLITSGEVRLGAKLSASQSWVDSFDAGGAVLKSRLKAGASYTVNWIRSGRYELKIERSREDRLKLRLRATDKERTARALSIGAEVTIRGTRQAVAPLMKEIAQLPDSLDKLVQTYSKPSELIRQKFSQQIKGLNPTEHALISAAISGDSAENIAEILLQPIMDSAEARIPGWTELLEGWLAGLAEKAASEFELPIEKRPDFGKLLNRLASKVLESLEKDLRSSLAKALKQDADPITRKLNEFAGRRKAGLKKLDASADACLVPLKTLLVRYRALEKKAMKVVEAAEKEKLILRYARSVTHQEADEALLEFDLDPGDAEANGLYRQMLGGDFAEAMIAGLDDENSAIKLRKSFFKRVFQDRETSGITFNLFGIELASRTSLSATLKVERASGGRIKVFRSKGSVQKEHAALGEAQSMRVGSLLNFVTARKAPGAFVVELKYIDKHMKRKELREYIGSFEAHGLIAGGATNRIDAKFDDVGAIADGKREMQIDTLFALSRDEVRKMCARNEEEIIRVAIEQQVACFRRLPWALKSLQWMQQRIGDSLTVERGILGLRGAGRYKICRSLKIDVRNQSQLEKRTVHLIREITKRAELLAGFISRWSELDTIVEPKADTAVDTIFEDKDLADLRRLHREMLTDLRAWVAVRGVLKGLWQEDLSPISAAFLSALRELSDTADTPLVPILSWSTNSPSQKVAVA